MLTAENYNRNVVITSKNTRKLDNIAGGTVIINGGTYTNRATDQNANFNSKIYAVDDLGTGNTVTVNNCIYGEKIMHA